MDIVLRITLGAELKKLVKLESTADVIGRMLFDKEGKAIGKVVSLMNWDEEQILGLSITPQTLRKILHGCKIEGGRRLGVTSGGRLKPFKKKKK